MRMLFCTVRVLLCAQDSLCDPGRRGILLPALQKNDSTLTERQETNTGSIGPIAKYTKSPTECQLVHADESTVHGRG